MEPLPPGFPFRDIFDDFFTRYEQCGTYWYVPKTRALNDDNVLAAKAVLTLIFDHFLGRVWNPDTQDELLSALVDRKVLQPTAEGSSLSDRTALIRIWKKFLETLGLLWVQDDKEIIITDAGLDIIASDDPRTVVEGQIAKLQFPNPSLKGGYRDRFEGILPHLFLLQLLQKADYRLSVEEYELFANLAQTHHDLEDIARFVLTWRGLTLSEQSEIRVRAESISMGSGPPGRRYRRVHLNSAYQRALFAYPTYLRQEEVNGSTYITTSMRRRIDELVAGQLANLKVTIFLTLEDWFAYYGDPGRKPSWYTYLRQAVLDAKSKEEATRTVEPFQEHLTEPEKRDIQRLQVEKGIEEFYADRLALLEKGLSLLENGRQYATPIGRIDLLCKASDGAYVVIEIKADEASDSVFGQILRYIGWVHRNLPDAHNNVRGIILASAFPERARYARIGLLKPNPEHFLQFRRHGLDAAHT